MEPSVPSLFTALRRIRRDLRAITYLPVARYYPCDRGTLEVFTPRKDEGDGPFDVGRFEAVLIDPFGKVARRYRLRPADPKEQRPAAPPDPC